MSSKEKVIEELERVANAIVDGYIHEPDRAVNAIADAIAMLKKQNPVKPNRLLNEKVVSYKNVVYQYSCGNCSTLLRNSWKACPLCGREVKWDD